MATETDAIRQARGIIQEFALSDPTLWPILSEIDLVLSRAKPDEKPHRIYRPTHV